MMNFKELVVPDTCYVTMPKQVSMRTWRTYCFCLITSVVMKFPVTSNYLKCRQSAVVRTRMLSKNLKIKALVKLIYSVNKPQIIIQAKKNLCLQGRLFETFANEEKVTVYSRALIIILDGLQSQSHTFMMIHCCLLPYFENVRVFIDLVYLGYRINIPKHIFTAALK